MWTEQGTETKLFATEIIAIQNYPGGFDDWVAGVNFQDYGHANKTSIGGRWFTKYGQSLEDAINVILKDAQDEGISITRVGQTRIPLVVEPYNNNPETLGYVENVANKLGLRLVEIKNVDVNDTFSKIMNIVHGEDAVELVLSWIFNQQSKTIIPNTVRLLIESLSVSGQRKLAQKLLSQII